MTREAMADDARIVEPRDAYEVVDVQHAATGDGQAFERVYHRHVAAVRRVIHGKGCHEDADDLTQEVFVRAWRDLRHFRRDATFRTWITRIAVNAVTDRYRSSASRQRYFEPLTSAHLDVPTNEPLGAELAIAVRAAIATLPGRDRKVMVMHHVLGYPHREIAGHLGMPVGTIKSLLYRARRVLRGRLEARADFKELGTMHWRVSQG